ncbi:uncharacterized protein LOC134841996 [Symsagittifera roscoffensis]|uniref:uncharacterized protein LOC134841996 n=1 Tax=Symsagittifera roscoffensis TaxID=84072 RepID=UPI00307C71BC
MADCRYRAPFQHANSAPDGSTNTEKGLTADSPKLKTSSPCNKSRKFDFPQKSNQLLEKENQNPVGTSSGSGNESLLSKNQSENSDSLNSELKSILEQIESGQLKASTPILTNVFTRNSMIYITAEKVKLLQQFAEKMKNNKEFEALKIRPFHLKVSNKPTFVCGQALKSDQIDESFNCEVVAKVFLNGTGNEAGKSVSVCVSVVNKDADRQNLLEGRKLIVSIYLKDLNENKPYRKDFKMDFSPELEKGEKGLLKFVSKRELDDYITDDGAVTFGVSILLGSQQHTEQ